MIGGKSYFKKLRKSQKWLSFTVTFSLMFILIPYSGNTEETARNSLPSNPDTGSPEEEFAAGGTRDNRLLTHLCGENSQQIVYLLGDQNREFTLSAHPTFWFYISNKLNKISQIEFVLTELETGYKVYNRIVTVPAKANIKANLVGITLPAEQKYALSPNVNYSWHLKVDCAESNKESIVVLEGWLYRLPLNTDLQNQLATASQEEKYGVYLKNNFLYDALNDLAQLHIKEPNNPQIEIAWNQLLTELGWHNLAQQSVVKPYVLEPNLTYAETK